MNCAICNKHIKDDQSMRPGCEDKVVFPLSSEDEIICPECGEPCDVVPLDNSFDYSGTHCTHGKPGTHYPSGYGYPVSSCCEADMEGYEL